MKEVTLIYDEHYNLKISDNTGVIKVITNDLIVSEIVCLFDERQFNRLDKGYAITTKIDLKYITA